MTTVLSPGALAVVAAAIGADPPVHLLRDAPWRAGRRWAIAEETGDYQAWVIGWPPDTGLALHDHRGSSAGVHVVSGRLRERYLGAGRLHTRAWTPDAGFELPADHVHEVVSVGSQEAITIHVYSPRLIDVRFRIDAALDGPALDGPDA